jgi:hypothetical protein
MAHESHRSIKEEWLTPQWLLARLGEFDLDPCAPHSDRRPWPTATNHLSKRRQPNRPRVASDGA